MTRSAGLRLALLTGATGFLSSALVVHCGARVNTRLPYESLCQTNVGGTGELLHVAEAAAAPFADRRGDSACGYPETT